MRIFVNAQDAFEDVFEEINKNGSIRGNTKTIFNCGFYISEPLENHIGTSFRKWNPKYAEREWKWYLSGDPNAEEISKFAPIWEKHMDENGNVRSR